MTANLCVAIVFLISSAFAQDPALPGTARLDWTEEDPSVRVMDGAHAFVEREIAEDDPTEGSWVTEQLNRIWRKYIGQGDEYGLRDPSIDERRVLFVCNVDSVATFGKS
jgi:hypothetical protein